MRKFTAIFKKTDKWWIGYVIEIPGANTQGRTLEEARENLKEAVKLILEAQEDLIRQELHEGQVVCEELVL